MLNAIAHFPTAMIAGKCDEPLDKPEDAGGIGGGAK